MTDVLKVIRLVGGRRAQVGGGAKVGDHRQQRELATLLQSQPVRSARSVV